MKQTWTLDNIFSESSFLEHLGKIDPEAFLKLPLPEALLLSQECMRDLEEARSYVHCLVSQDVNDQKAKEWLAKVSELDATFAKANVELDVQLEALTEDKFESLLRELDDIEFVLRERRELAKKRLGAEKESLIEDLSVNGYHGWSQMYDTLTGSMKFSFRGESLSQGQIENYFSHADRSVRKDAFENYLAAFDERRDEFGMIMNHFGGFRWKMYEARGWDDIVQEPCDLNRLSKDTLDVMWDVVAKNRGIFAKYLDAKAKLLGVEKLSWYDLEAPLGKSEINYEEGVEFILKHFNAASEKMGAFAKKMLEAGWVESEDRKGKRNGGFCINFPKSRETRIFMTYSDTVSNVVTLAHELGHAYHAECCFTLPCFNQQYRMNVAETASTMAEMIVSDAACKEAKNDEERLVLLDEKIGRSVAYLMNLHARYLFETRFYAERKKGFVLPNRLSELMVEAQREAYCNKLDEYHPLFWASKLHFYFGDVPFYNFPYTFGYLFSMGIYSALDKGEFEDKFVALLRDTGRMTTETLAEKHLGVDLKKPDFWQAGIDSVVRDVEEFIKMSADLARCRE